MSHDILGRIFGTMREILEITKTCYRISRLRSNLIIKERRLTTDINF
jgi:hypothetical protein